MAGQFSGLTPALISFATQITAAGATVSPVVKFPTIHTIVDTFWCVQTAISTNDSTTHMRVRVLDGGTTGSGTTSAVNRSGTWTAYTGVTIGTNYEFAANDWALSRYSEAGTVAAGAWAQVMHVVNGSM